MIRIQKLKRPTKRSGYELRPKATTVVRGLTIVNKNTFSVYVDKFTPKKKPAKKKAAKK